MSKTLARQIRRIGMLPTTFTEFEERKLVMDPQTTERREEIVTIRHPERHQEELSAEEMAERKNRLVSEWRARRKGAAA